MAFPNLLRKLFSDGGKGAKLRPEIVPDIEKPGTIKFWYGEAQNVPTGWAICDGTNGTPDLRDLVIVGAGKSYRLGEKFGSASVLPKVTAGTGKTGISVEQVTASVSVGGPKRGSVFRMRPSMFGREPLERESAFKGRHPAPRLWRRIIMVGQGI